MGPADTKVLFVITKSNWGGAQSYVCTLATRLKETGTEVAVALGGTGEAGADAGLLAERLNRAGVRTIFLSSFARDVGIRREWAAFFELLRVIRTEKPDILHLNSSKAGGLGALAGRIAGVRKIIFTAHGWAHREPRPLYQRASIWLASWLTAQLCHQVIAVSEYDLHRAPVIFSRKNIRVVHNGVGPLPLLSQAEARTKLAARIGGVSHASFWFVTLAELHPNKGLDTLIRSFKEIAAEHADTTLILIGEGQSRTELESLIHSLELARRVFLVGFFPNAHELLGAADVFVLPSRKEGLPFSILEAGMARLPVIATRVGAVPEIIENGVSGLLVSPDNATQLTEALRTMYEDATLRERVGEALHANVVRHFSEETMFKQTLAAYH